MRYLLHNVYGDCDSLVASRPSNVQCLSRGWTPESEQEFNEWLAESGLVGISCLPCLMEWVPDLNRWIETRVADLDKPWTWEKIEAAHANAVLAASLHDSQEPPLGG